MHPPSEDDAPPGGYQAVAQNINVIAVDVAIAAAVSFIVKLEGIESACTHPPVKASTS
jgi:hypothetical protein